MARGALVGDAVRPDAWAGEDGPVSLEVGPAVDTVGNGAAPPVPLPVGSGATPGAPGAANGGGPVPPVVARRTLAAVLDARPTPGPGASPRPDAPGAPGVNGHSEPGPSRPLARCGPPLVPPIRSLRSLRTAPQPAPAGPERGSGPGTSLGPTRAPGAVPAPPEPSADLRRCEADGRGSTPVPGPARTAAPAPALDGRHRVPLSIPVPEGRRPLPTPPQGAHGVEAPAAPVPAGPGPGVAAPPGATTTLPAPPLAPPVEVAEPFRIRQAGGAPPRPEVGIAEVDEGTATTSGSRASADDGSGRRGPRWAGLERPQLLRVFFVASGWVRNVGAIMILFAAWQLWGTSIQHHYAQQTLRTEFQAKVEHETVPGDNPTLTSDAHVPDPRAGSVVGRLQIPAIGVDQYVVEGTSETQLAMGPGHYVGTSMPGQAGNVAIAGHRTTYGAPFNALNELRIGDPIDLTTAQGTRLTYVVAEAPFVVSPSDVRILNTTDDNRVTLTTCNPKFSSTQRLVVVGLLSHADSTQVTKVVVTPHRVKASGADDITWRLPYLPAVLALLLGLVLLGACNDRARRVYGRGGRYLVLVPIWGAGIFFLFEALSKLLPANL